MRRDETSLSEVPWCTPARGDTAPEESVPSFEEQLNVAPTDERRPGGMGARRDWQCDAAEGRHRTLWVVTARAAGEGSPYPADDVQNGRSPPGASRSRGNRRQPAITVHGRDPLALMTVSEPARWWSEMARPDRQLAQLELILLQRRQYLPRPGHLCGISVPASIASRRYRSQSCQLFAYKRPGT